ncbi:sialic acid-binding Ig-like lectin 14 isoform X2 [Saccopteryx bilineata]|uniref:sialic acid-binding Ig-like lectin 14 isoform X2 n=1 Tax=Saccopteryx bilineata TaxID=59482 RepID=UPI00338D9A4A
MVPLLLLPLLWGGSLQQQRGYELRVQESVTVQEGLFVHVPCSFFHPWGLGSYSDKLYTYWYQRADDRRSYLVATNNPRETVKREAQGRFLLADPSNGDCSLSLRDARTSDRGTYSFRVERGYNEQHHYLKQLTLQVTDRTEKPDIHLPEPLESGRPAHLACSLPGCCERGGHRLFSWVGAAVDSTTPQMLPYSVLTFTPRPRDHGTNLTCQVKHDKYSVAMERTVRLNVLSLKILQTTSSLPILEGEAVRLLCEADSNPPAELSWFRGSPALKSTHISSTATLELPHVGTAEEGEFSCLAQNPLGSQHVSFSLSVQRSPPPRSCVTEEQRGSWPLVLTLIRGALMGTGFLLTYGLTWLYYTRCGGHQRKRTTS